MTMPVVRDVAARIRRRCDFRWWIDRSGVALEAGGQHSYGAAEHLGLPSTRHAEASDALFAAGFVRAYATAREWGVSFEPWPNGAQMATLREIRESVNWPDEIRFYWSKWEPGRATALEHSTSFRKLEQSAWAFRDLA